MQVALFVVVVAVATAVVVVVVGLSAAAAVACYFLLLLLLPWRQANFDTMPQLLMALTSQVPVATDVVLLCYVLLLLLLLLLPLEETAAATAAALERAPVVAAFRFSKPLSPNILFCFFFSFCLS